MAQTEQVTQPCDHTEPLTTAAVFHQALLVAVVGQVSQQDTHVCCPLHPWPTYKLRKSEGCVGSSGMLGSSLKGNGPGSKISLSDSWPEDEHESEF